MGVDLEMEKNLDIFLCFDLCKYLDSLTNENIKPNIKNLIDKLSSFFLSDKLIPFLSIQNFPQQFNRLIHMFEKREKFLTLKIIFPLGEELGNLKFGDILLEKIKHKMSKEDLKSYTNGLLQNNKELMKLLFSPAGDQNILSKYYNKENESNLNLYYLYSMIFIFTFFDVFTELSKGDKKNKKKEDNILIALYRACYVNFFSLDEIENIIDYLKQLDSLNHTKNAYQNVLLFLNIKKNEKEILSRDKIDEIFFDIYGDTHNINETMIWIFYEKNKEGNNYNKIILKGKKTQNVKYNFDIFDNINELKVKEDIRGINGNIYKSLFYNTNIIVIRIDIDNYKKNKITLEQIQNDINIYKEYYKSKYNNLDLYVQLENNIFNLDKSYNLILDRIKKDLNAFNFEQIYNEIESQEFNINNHVEHLFSFCSSFDFEVLLFEDKSKILLFTLLIAIYESKEKYLSIKIFFLLLEEMKKMKYDNEINELFQLIIRFPKSIQKLYNSNYKYFNKSNLTECKNIIKIDIDRYIKDNSAKFDGLLKFYGLALMYIFNNIFKPFLIQEMKDNFDNFLNFIYGELHKISKEEINYLIENLIQLNSLNHIKDEFNKILFILNLIKHEQEKSLLDKINNKFFEYFDNAININDKIIWILYEEDTNSNKSKNEKKYPKILLEGKMTVKEKYNFEILSHFSGIKDNNYIKEMSGKIFDNIFENKKLLLIEMDLELINKNKLTLELIEEKINIIKNSFLSENNNLETYIQIENKIINLDISYDLFIQELFDKKIIDVKTKNNYVKNKLNDIKIKKENNEINNNEKIKITKETNVNQKLDKINKGINEIKMTNEINSGCSKKEFEELKLQLTKEKDKNKKLEKDLKESEKIINDLRKEIKKYEELQIKTEENKITKMNLGEKTKESLIEKIIEKDNEINDLRTKLSRLPFILEEGEKLISIIFTSSDQNLHYSIICKNTDEFHKVEGQLYKDNPAYSENENYFLLGGRKINKYRTLKENGIENNSIIILYPFCEE